MVGASGMGIGTWAERIWGVQPKGMTLGTGIKLFRETTCLFAKIKRYCLGSRLL